MSCINPNNKDYQELLNVVGNPLVAELIYDEAYTNGISPEERDTYIGYMVDEIAKDVKINSPAFSRDTKMIGDIEIPTNTYSIKVVEDSKKITNLESAHEVAQKQVDKLNNEYAQGLTDIAKVDTSNGVTKIKITLNKEHVTKYIVKNKIDDYFTQQEYYSEAKAHIAFEEGLNNGTINQHCGL